MIQNTTYLQFAASPCGPRTIYPMQMLLTQWYKSLRPSELIKTPSFPRSHIFNNNIFREDNPVGVKKTPDIKEGSVIKKKVRLIKKRKI